MNNQLRKSSRHFQNPQNAGQVSWADAAGQAGSAANRNLVQFTASIKDTVIKDIRFKAFGCDWTIASASYITTLAMGKDLFEAAKITSKDLKQYFGPIPEKNMHAAQTVIEAFSCLISDYMAKMNQRLYASDPKRVAVAVSGGIDSAVCARILKDQGYKVFGITMNILPSGDGQNHGPKDSAAPTDIQLARQVCGTLDIPHFVMNLQKQFKKTIMDFFLSEYLKGRTPNPCVACNKFIKFGELLQQSFLLGAAFLASGHYCILDSNKNQVLIRKGKDPAKDQSYMLWRLDQSQLAHIKFPLGKFHKHQIKKMGVQYFPFLKEKPESQDICFLGKKGYHTLLSESDISAGKIINSQGKILGTHKGYPYYTIGQRKGLGISWPRPLYVTKILPSENILVVGEKEALLQKQCSIKKTNFIAGNPPAERFAAQVMIRYQCKPVPAVIHITKNHSARCVFDHAQPAITPGQSAVFYQEDLLLGGGIIGE